VPRAERSAQIPDYPAKARFLSEDEKAALLARLAADSDAADEEAISWRAIKQALTDPLLVVSRFKICD
jgi:hypothetical protein